MRASPLGGDDPGPTPGWRDALLATRCHSVESLSRVRGDASVEMTREWVARKFDDDRLFAVCHEGTMVIPGFQLTDLGEPREDLAGVLPTLRRAGVREWTLWVWLTSSTPWLSGGTPAEVVSIDRVRVEHAAARFVSRDAP